MNSSYNAIKNFLFILFISYGYSYEVEMFIYSIINNE